VQVSTLTAVQQVLFAARWDVRYWRGQYRLPGADHDRIHAEIRKLNAKIDRIQGELR
jgi:hypothetical protein